MNDLVLSRPGNGAQINVLTDKGVMPVKELPYPYNQ